MNEQEQRILWQAKINALESLRQLLSRCLNPQRHYAYLRSQKILNLDDQERIENTAFTTAERAGKFLDVLVTKGPNAFDELYNSIKTEGTQTFLLQEMNRCLEENLRRLQRPAHDNRVMLTDNNLPGPPKCKDSNC